MNSCGAGATTVTSHPAITKAQLEEVSDRLYNFYATLNWVVSNFRRDLFNLELLVKPESDRAITLIEATTLMADAQGKTKC
jgi:hypothetical protein